MTDYFVQKTKDKIAPEFLTSPIFAEWTKEIASDSSLSIWFCRKKGKQNVQGGIYGKQTIRTKKFPKNAYKAVKSELKKIDRLTGLDIKLVKNSRNADIKVFFDEKIELNSIGGHDGIAVFNHSEEQNKSWEIFLSAKNIQTNNYLVYATLHEIQHALGLEHPHDNADNDFYLSTSIRSSAGAHQTLMSYDSPGWGIYPNLVSLNDIEALQHIWGESDNTSKVFIVNDNPVRPSIAQADNQDIISVDSSVTSDFTIKGRGEKNSRLRLTLFNQLIGESKVNRNGKWKFEIDGDLLNSYSSFTGAILQVQQLDPFGHLSNSPSYSLVEI